MWAMVESLHHQFALVGDGGIPASAMTVHADSDTFANVSGEIVSPRDLKHHVKDGNVAAFKLRHLLSVGHQFAPHVGDGGIPASAMKIQRWQ
jgi:hypothetical protein